jgi:hypothetical protein
MLQYYHKAGEVSIYASCVYFGGLGILGEMCFKNVLLQAMFYPA